ncbi:MAG TPA: AAA family ATPase, partial [Candidatus Binatia bacterium]|nr:AAA family ATPase [Candidatus Binatia bacterium]
MAAMRHILFPPFRLDPGNQCLRRGAEVIPLRRKTFAVLRYLVEHPGRVVTKQELLAAVWPNTYVSAGVPTVCIRELRKALGEGPAAPRFIETVPRRGYRFIGEVTGAEESHQWSVTLVGREGELRQLQGWLEKALGGERQVVFVTGEAGVGKTTLVEGFLERVATDSELWIGRGQCVEHYGAGEAYLPILEALERLCRRGGDEHLIGLLRRHAPMWLAQLPSLISPVEREELQRQLVGAAQERMLREMAAVVEALTAEKGLVLWLEDLHWGDYSTLSLLAYLARRRERARLLVIGTYRPVDVLSREHPLRGVKQELQLHRHCQELALGFLTEENIAEYLTVRFPVGATGRSPLQKLARAIHQRTDGNPLFMVNVADNLVAQGVIVRRDGRWELNGEIEEVAVETPASLRQFIEQQIERAHPAERQVLEAASVAGVEFSAVAVAAGIATEVEEVEKCCEGLARRGQFLRASGMGEWPDGMVASRYSFIHALYQNVLYDRVTAARRVRLHRKIGERVEGGYGEQAGEIAAELAVHFERGRDYHRAARYRQRAGENAVQRRAYREAIDHLTKGLELLKTLPDTPERAQQELTLHITLGSPLMATKGLAAPEVEKVYTRARELCQQVGEIPQLFPALQGLWAFYYARAELQTTRELGEQLLRLAQRVQDPELRLEAHRALGVTLWSLGELTSARVHLEQGIALYEPLRQRAQAVLYGGPDAGVSCLSYVALILCNLGYPDQALQRSREALTVAQELSHPFSWAAALIYAAGLHLVRREWQTAQERAEAAVTLSTEQGFRQLVAFGTILRGRALAQQGQEEEGIAQLCQGLAAFRATGAEQGRPGFLAWLAAAYGKVGQIEEGLTLLAEALHVVDKTGQRMDEAELYRLKGELSLQSRQVKTGQDKSEDTDPRPLTPDPQS